MTFCKFSTFAAALLLVNACSFQNPSQGGGDRGTTGSFRLGTTKGSARTLDSDAYGIPTRKAIDFQVCVRERISGTAIAGAPVKVAGADAPTNGATDGDGCVRWTEEVRYPHLRREKFVEWPRRLEVGEVGASTLRLAIDPWVDGDGAVNDFTLAPPPPGLALVPAASSRSVLDGAVVPLAGESNLIVETTSVGKKLLPGDTRHFDLQFSLAAARQLLGGTWGTTQLKKGKFAVRFGVEERLAGKLVAPALAEDVVVASEPIKGGFLTVGADVKYRAGRTLGADKFLRFTITPIEKSALDPVQGYCKISWDDSIGEACKLVDAATGSEIAPRSLGTRNLPFLFQSVDISAGSRVRSDDWSLGIELVAKVCLVRSDTNAPIVPTAPGQFRFLLSEHAKVDRKKLVYANDEQGNCFTVRQPEAVHFDVAQPEKHVTRFLHVVGDSGPYADSGLVYAFDVNPAQHAKSELFYQGPKATPLPAKYKNAVAQLVLTGPTCTATGRVPRVNRFLQNMNLLRYRLVLHPQLLFEARTDTGEAELRPVSDGTRLRVHGVFSTPAQPGDTPSEHDYLGDFATTITVRDKGELKTNVYVPIDFPEEPRLRGPLVLTLRVSPEATSLTNGARPRIYTLNMRKNGEVVHDDVSYGTFLRMIPPTDASRDGAVVHGREKPLRRLIHNGDFTEAETTLSRASSVRLVDTADVEPSMKLYGVQVPLVGEPIELFARYLGETGPLVKLHLDGARGAFTDWDSAVKATDDSSFVADLEKRGLKDTLTKFLKHNAKTPAKLPEEILAALCAWYGPKRNPGTETTKQWLSVQVGLSERKTCEQVPGAWFDLATVVVADEVRVDSPGYEYRLKEGLPLPEGIALQASFFKEQGFQDRVISGEKASVTAAASLSGKAGSENLGFGFGAGGGINGAHETFHTSEIGVTDAVRTRRSNSRTINLTVREWPVPLVGSVHSCVYARPVGDADYKPSNTSAFLICARAEDVRREEKWFHIIDPSTGPGSADPAYGEVRGWTRVVRGEGALARVKRKLEDSTLGAAFHAVRPWQNSLQAVADGATATLIEGVKADDFSQPGVLPLIFRDGGLFPGVFEFRPLSRSFREGWTEEVFAMKTHVYHRGLLAQAIVDKLPTREVDIDGKKEIVPDLVSEKRKQRVLQYLQWMRAYSRCVISEAARRCTTNVFAHGLPFCFAPDLALKKEEIEAAGTPIFQKVKDACNETALRMYPQ